MNFKSEFERFAMSQGIGSGKMHRYKEHLAAAHHSATTHSYSENALYAKAHKQPATSEYISPTIIEERQLNVATMDVFSRLMMDRIIFLGVPIYDDAANIIQAQLLFLESTDPRSDIQIYLNTPGGSVSAGLGIYDTMQLISPDVATICTGMAASMGAILLTAGAKDKRSALRHSRVMIHQPLGGVEGQASDIAITARQILRTKEELYGILAEHSGATLEQIERDADRDFWMSSLEAKEYGIIDNVLTKRPL